MRAPVVLIIAVGLFSAYALADTPATKCFEAESGAVFSTTETIALGMSLEAKMPQVESDSEGNPTKLNWVPRPDNTTVEVEQVGLFHTRGIYRVIYREHSETAQSAKPQMVCVMFGYQDSVPEGMGIRPFFISATDHVRWMESYFTSDKDQAFALVIDITSKGNGVYWSSFTFAFTPGEARIISRSDGGRKMHTKTYSYDESGKVIQTKISEEQ